MTVTGPDLLALQVRDLERSASSGTHLGLRRVPAGVPIPVAPVDGRFGRTTFSDADGYAATSHDQV